jgi:glycosyltransferase involved in cell wall biosynthesis
MRAALRYIAEDAPSGYGDAADRLVRALRAGGTRVEFRGWSDTRNGAAPATVPFSRDDRPLERAAPHAPTVAHLVPEYYPLVREYVGEAPLVAHTVWETDRIPQHWPGLLNATDLVVVPSEWNRTVFGDGGVRVPVVAIPHIACDPVTSAQSLGVPDDLIVFYTIGRWNERKAIVHTVRAFLDAFTADDPVVLVVKTGTWTEMPPAPGFGDDNPLRWTTGWQLAAIVSGYRKPASVRLEVGTWSPDRIAALHTRGDCYVALARGEGWGLGAFDACAYGNPVVATGWGGVLEYLTPEGASLVDYELAAVEHDAVASYSPDQRWAEPNLEHAVELLRAVAGDLRGARTRAAPLRDRVLRDFAPGVVSRRFRDALSRTTQSASPGSV